MKKTIFISILLVAATIIGCYKTIQTGPGGGSLILAYPSTTVFNTASSGLDYFNNALLGFSLGDATDTLLVSANIPKPFDKDVTVSIAVDQDAFASFTKSDTSGNNYQAMPTNYYQIVTTSATIAAGQTAANFKVVFYPSLFDISATSYLLPVSISNDPGYPVDNNFKTAYFHIIKDPYPNLAKSKPTDQSGTAFGGLSSRAVDGNTDGAFGDGSVTHTDLYGQDQAWWEVDLGAVPAYIKAINIYNRTDCCGQLLANYHVLIADQPFTGTTLASAQAEPGVRDYPQTAIAGTPTTIDIDQAGGRYIRVQLESGAILSLAEVQVRGNW